MSYFFRFQFKLALYQELFEEDLKNGKVPPQPKSKSNKKFPTLKGFFSWNFGSVFFDENKKGSILKIPNF